MIKKHGLNHLLKQYWLLILLLVVLTILPGALNLAVPKIISQAIDSFSHSTFNFENFILEFSVVAVFIFIFTYLQSVLQVYAGEKIARDLRTRLSAKISMQDNSYVENIGSASLLTNLTNDVDNVKNYISQAIGSIISSIFLILGASTLLIIINWKLALPVLTVVPIIAVTFFYVFTKLRKLFKRSQAALDWLNKIINESILGSAIIRIVNSESLEFQKFLKANTEARDISLQILGLFASIIPVITFLTNMATLVILTLGGHFVIIGTMSLGDFTAFNSYLAILIFPILIIGFMSNIISQAQASYERIENLIHAPNAKADGKIVAQLSGDLKAQNLNLFFDEKTVLKNISFETKPGTRTAIVGPTGSGKTQLLYVLTGLVKPTSGEVLYDDKKLEDYNKQSLHSQVGMVFQDSVLFNLSLKENIAFSDTVSDQSLKKAIETSELNDFVDSLPKGLEEIVSERGTSLSGGQKQRVMLARALALNPKILFLDDFTARVDTRTEKKILENLKNNYPDLTLISVTQKIGSIEDYDKILVLEDGEIIASGTHQELLKTSPEYMQIFDSQESTENL